MLRDAHVIYVLYLCRCRSVVSSQSSWGVLTRARGDGFTRGQMVMLRQWASHRPRCLEEQASVCPGGWREAPCFPGHAQQRAQGLSPASLVQISDPLKLESKGVESHDLEYPVDHGG